MAAERPLAEHRWWPEGAVAVVTGANKGLGYEMARLLGQQGIHVAITSRDADRGKQALAALQQSCSTATFSLCVAEVTDRQSVQRCADQLSRQHGNITWLINNAGIAYRGDIFGADEAQHTLDVNLKGTRNVTEALLPVLQRGSRIINMCCRSGRLDQLQSEELRERFRHPAGADDIEALADQFVACIRDGTHQEQGWSDSMYGVAKLAETSYTVWLAEHLKDKGIVVNAVSPGYTATDMTGHKGKKTLREGADTPVWAALLAPAQVRSGAFYADREVLDWRSS